MKEKMEDFWRTYYLLIRKCFLVRRRHWKSILFNQILLPFFLMLLGMYLASNLRNNSYYASKDTIHLPEAIFDNATRDSPYYGEIQYMHVHYFPANDLTYLIGNETQKCLQISNDHIYGCETKDEAMDRHQQFSNWRELLVLDLTNIKDIKQKNLSYTVTSKEATLDNVSPNYLFDTSGYSVFGLYRSHSFLHFCLDFSLITLFAENFTKADPKLEFMVQRMPQPPHLEMRASVDYQVLVLASFASLAFILVLCMEIGYIAKEKFMGTNFLMSINGLPVYKNLLSWHVSAVSTSVIYVTLCSLACLVSFPGYSDPTFVFRKNVFFFWLFLMIHVSNLIAFGIHIAAYFTNPLYATMIPCFLNTISFVLNVSINQVGITWRMPYIGFFFPSAFLYRAFQEADTYESIGTSISFSNLFTTADEMKYTAYSVGGIMVLSIFGTIFHLLMAVYVYHLFPGKYGTRENPFFPFMRLKRMIFNNSDHHDFSYYKMEIANLVPNSKDTPGIQIRDLKKTYVTGCFRKKTVEALKDVSLDFYKGQITALLGHNGAGKSTMMNILSGLTGPTSGKVFINGKNAKFQKQEILKDFGLCPQEDLMFQELSVFEQLRFFGKLKATHKSYENVDANVEEMLQKLNLSDKKNFLPHQLSGGQKRRLCLGLALIGDANTIILDEPTSGMDPETRRNVWDLILKMRGRKTIVLTTHNMEEADILADRVAIIHSGSLKCCDTPMALKKQYGHDHVEISFSTQPWCESGQVLNYFENKAEIVSFGNNKLVLSVPQMENLPDILDRLETDKGDLGITGISVSLITMNQVFFKVVDEKESTGDVQIENLYADKVTGRDLEHQWILAMLEKKLTYARKNFKTLLFLLLLPVLSLLVIGLTYSKYTLEHVRFPVNLDLYRNPISVYSSNEPSVSKIYENVVRSFNVSAEQVENNDVVEALLKIGKKDYSQLSTRCIASAAFNLTEDTLQAIALYQTEAVFGLPISFNLLSNALLRYYGNDDSYSIGISYENFLPEKSHQYPTRYRDIKLAVVAIMICVYLVIAIPIFVVQPLRENATKFKQVQRMTGLSAIIYWGTNFLFDFIVMLISIAIFIIGLAVINDILDIQLFFSVELGVLFSMCTLYTINVLAIVYLFSFLNRRIGSMVVTLVSLPIGTALVQFGFVGIWSALRDPYKLSSLPVYLFRITPYMNFLHGLISLLGRAEARARCRFNAEHYYCEKPFAGYLTDSSRDDFFDKPATNLKWLLIMPLFYFGLLFLVEFGIPSRLKQRMFQQNRHGYVRDMDELVKKEKELVAREVNARRYHWMRTAQSEPQRTEPEDASWSNVLRTPNDESLFVAFELSKSYGSLHAVKEISFSVRHRECFGLLGVNGAGKSSTFKMLTGDEIPDGGCIYLGAANLEKHRIEYLAQLGYCPQIDPLIPSFDAYDHLKLFAALRGIKRSKINEEVKKWIDRLNLTSCANQASKTYCGADKRRLSTAIALIGNPGLVLLDEPTNGLDPSARRAMWKVLKACQAAGQSIILTSHSMEECEVLCDRLVIMVEGQLVCIGPNQQLKQRFGAGCNVQLKIDVERSEEDLWKIKNLVQSKLKCTLVDENLSFLSYHITDPKTTWRSMYDVMRDVKEKYECVNDFSVQSATLEELFIQFAKGSKKPVEV